MLDTDEGVYLWRGAKVDVSQLRIIQRACEEYCKDKPLAVGRRVIPVQDGHEPPIFRARFQAWDDGGSGEDKKFEDVYEKRVVQLTVRKEGRGQEEACGGLYNGFALRTVFWAVRY